MATQLALFDQFAFTFTADKTLTENIVETRILNLRPELLDEADTLADKGILVNTPQAKRTWALREARIRYA